MSTESPKMTRLLTTKLSSQLRDVWFQQTDHFLSQRCFDHQHQSMTTVDSAGWLDRLVQDIAHADANSLHAVRTSLAEVAGSDPDTAVASVVKQLSDVRKHLTAVARQVFAARMASAGPTCSSALAWATQACDDAARLRAALVELAREQAPAADESGPGQISRSAWLAVGASLIAR